MPKPRRPICESRSGCMRKRWRWSPLRTSSASPASPPDPRRTRQPMIDRGSSADLYIFVAELWKSVFKLRSNGGPSKPALSCIDSQKRTRYADSCRRARPCPGGHRSLLKDEPGGAVAVRGGADCGGEDGGVAPTRKNANREAAANRLGPTAISGRSEEHTSELQSLMRISYAVFCLKKKKT